MIQKICDKAVNTYPSTIQFVSDCYKTQEMCDEAFNKYFIEFIDVPDWYKTHKSVTVLVLNILLQ